MHYQRYRLLCLWISSTTFMVAASALVVRLALGWQSPDHLGERWHAVIMQIAQAGMLLSFVLGISNKPGKYTLLVAMTFAAAVVALLTLQNNISAYTGLFLVAFATTGYAITRDALLPAVADDTHWWLPRMNAYFLMGGVVGIGAGVWIALKPDATPALPLGFFMASLLSALPAQFASDVNRRETTFSAAGNFLRDTFVIGRNWELLACLLGLTVARAVLALLLTGLVVPQLDAEELESGLRFESLQLGFWLLAGAGASALFLWCIQGHPRRILGKVPFAATGLTIGLTMIAAGVRPCPTLSFLLGMTLGAMLVPLSATYQGNLPAEARGNGLALLGLVGNAGILALLAVFYSRNDAENLLSGTPLVVLTVCVGLLALISWRFFLRHVLEWMAELIIVPFYRVVGHGPGIAQVPRTGPVIIIANHTSWMDPVWLCRVLPRNVIALMTSKFYDLPILHWLMKNVAHAIRVPDVRFRRDVPEIEDAVAALDRGEALIVFPEGSIRRKNDVCLHNFGQGIWLILKQRPDIPVVACWVEGGWGSYLSFFNGPPTKNKPIDRRRHIDIGVAAAQVLDPAIIEDQRATRNHLMQACLDARSLLGLEPLPRRLAELAISEE